MEKLPDKDQLLALRKGLRKRKLPVVRSGMCGSFEQLGSFSVTKAADSFLIEWKVKDGISKSLSFKDLCTDPGLELDRLELGWLIAAMFDFEAQRIMDSIGHPIEAFNAASEPRKAADDWRGITEALGQSESWANVWSITKLQQNWEKLIGPKQ